MRTGLSGRWEHKGPTHYLHAERHGTIENDVFVG
jgi:hypothetical protein